ncbi:MAG: lytic transglycosylase domain-containing protein [Bacteroidota bacterium]|nr:lytic transglycosylase domain-containing protein [Bacteroidota bacterium]MDP4273304.1 lytic transglycosylase domain-containing protein [Bacteroidota bacterium]
MKLFNKDLGKKDRRIITVGILTSIAILEIVLFCFFKDKESDDENYRNAFAHQYGIYSPELPDRLNFAGEPVPLNDFDVKESLDKELMVNIYWQSQTLLFLKKAHRFFPVIEPILKKNHIPDDFKYLAVAESGLSNEVSPAGARGFWQLLEKTAKDCGLEVNEEVDERYNLEKATEAACQYLRSSYKTQKNWTLVAASYNIGKTGVSRQLSKQKVDNYYDLLFGEETARYIFRILAIKLIITNPDKYGYHLREKDLYPIIPVTKIKIDSSVDNWSDFAQSHSVNYKILKIFNPWLKGYTLTNKEKKTYMISLPQKGLR